MTTTTRPLTATRVTAATVGDLPTSTTVPTPADEAAWELDPQGWIDYAATRAAATVRDHHVGAPETNVDRAIVGLLRDLRHLCDAAGLRYVDLDLTATYGYWDDRNQHPHPERTTP